MRPAVLPLLLLLSSACGDDGGSGNPTGDAPASTIDAPLADVPSDELGTPSFAVTSPTITNGGAIPLTHACVSKGGMNLSPQLVFVSPPTGTMSYAVVLTDLTISGGFVHSAIYDVPGTAIGLPADVDKVYAPPDVPGAHQTNAYTNQRGYAGPCPNAAHMYQFKVYALSTATLPGGMMNTTKEQVVTAVTTNLGTATLTATFTP